MRIGIDAHILLQQHKRYSRKIAAYTEDMVTALIKADKKQEHTWVLFFDGRMADNSKLNMFLKALDRPNIEVKHFPFVTYRRYLPVVYSHMLISAFLRSAKLDIFHSPEGLIPIGYTGNMIATFHYVPRGKLESNLFVRTFMLGARVAFAGMCRRAARIVLESENDLELMKERWGYPEKRLVLLPLKDSWSKKAEKLLAVYKELKPKKRVKKKAKKVKTKVKKGK